MSVVRFKFLCNILISGKIIKEMPGSVAGGTTYRNKSFLFNNPFLRVIDVGFMFTKNWVGFSRVILQIFQPLIHAWKPQYNVGFLLTLAVQTTGVAALRNN